MILHNMCSYFILSILNMDIINKEEYEKNITMKTKTMLGHETLLFNSF